MGVSGSIAQVRHKSISGVCDTELAQYRVQVDRPKWLGLLSNRAAFA